MPLWFLPRGFKLDQSFCTHNTYFYLYFNDFFVYYILFIREVVSIFISPIHLHRNTNIMLNTINHNDSPAEGICVQWFYWSSRDSNNSLRRQKHQENCHLFVIVHSLPVSVTFRASTFVVELTVSLRQMIEMSEVWRREIFFFKLWHDLSPPKVSKILILMYKTIPRLATALPVWRLVLVHQHYISTCCCLHANLELNKVEAVCIISFCYKIIDQLSMYQYIWREICSKQASENKSYSSHHKCFSCVLLLQLMQWISVKHINTHLSRGDK